MRRCVNVGLLVLALGAGGGAEAMAVQAQATSHTVRPGDTLWGLAREYLGDPRQWRSIYEANQDRITNPDLIVPGQQLVIPSAGATAPAVVQAVTVEAAVEPMPMLPTQPAGLPPEASQRTVFYGSGDPLAVGPTVLVRPPEERPAVQAGDYYAAGWIEPEPLDTAAGRVTAVLESGGATRSARMARPFDAVDLSLRVAGAVGVGDRLLIVRIERRVPDYGRIVRPVGVVTVSRVNGPAATAVVSTELDRMMIGDEIRPFVPYVERPGIHPRPVQGGLEAQVVAFRDPGALYGPSDIAFLNAGSNQGIAVGDEFVVMASAQSGASPSAVGRLQVVHVMPSTASVRVLSTILPLSPEGLRAQLSLKMP